MSAPWTLRHAVDIAGQTMRAQLPVDDTRGAARLAWQLVALGAVVVVTPARAGHGCRACPAPAAAHCPGCGSCAPGYRCALTCPAGPDEVDQAAAELAGFDEHTARPLVVSGG